MLAFLMPVIFAQAGAAGDPCAAERYGLTRIQQMPGANAAQLGQWQGKLAQCEKQAATQRTATARAKAADAQQSRDLQEAAATRAAERAKDEQEQRRQSEFAAKALADQNADRERRLADPKQGGVYYSALLCVTKEERAHTTAEIKKRHGYARQTGVLNLTELNEWARDLPDLDDKITEIQGEMRTRKFKAMSCKEPTTRRVMACMRSGTDEAEAARCDSTEAMAISRLGDE